MPRLKRAQPANNNPAQGELFGRDIRREATQFRISSTQEKVVADCHEMKGGSEKFTSQRQGILQAPVTSAFANIAPLFTFGDGILQARK